MGKFWLRLLGIGEEEEADLDRRGFLKMLGGAAVVAAAPTYVFAPSGGWNSEEFVFSGGLTMAQPIMYTSLDYIVPALTDNYFKPSPLFTLLKSQTDTTKSFKQHKYRGFANV